jgi:hypothetical protein
MSFIRRFVQQDHDLVLDTSAVAVDNIFTTFSAVVTAANARNGLTRVKLTQNVTVSSGAYDLSRIIFVGDSQTLPVLILNSTATVTGTPPRELVNVVLENGKAAPLWTLSTSAQMTLRGNAVISGSSTDALVELNGNNFDLYVEDSAGFGTVPTGKGIINNANATTSTVYFKDSSTTTPDVNCIAVSGSGTMDLKYYTVTGHATHQELAVLFTTVEATLYKPQPYTVSPAQITSSQNNYSPVGLEHSNVLRINSDSAVNITGLDATNAGTGWFNPYKMIVNSGSFAITLKHQDIGSTAANRFIGTSGADVVLAASGGSAIVYYDSSDSRWRAFSVGASASGETNTASNVGTGTGLVFKQKTGVDLEFRSILEGYGLAVTNNTSDITLATKTTVTTLTDAATIAVDADIVNNMVTITANRTLGNPTNAAVGKALVVAVRQDGTGGRTLAFDTDYVNAGQLNQVALSANAVSVVVAYARNFGGGLKWYYTIHHNESVYQITPSQLTAVAATGTLTATGNFSNGDTVTTGTKTYTFQTTLTNVNGNVLIGASASDSLDNLIAAINLGAGSGTLYAAATTANTFVSAAAGAGDTMDVTALTAGSAGNSIATTETSSNASWGGATLSGGEEDTADYNPTGFSAANTLRVSTDASHNLQGMVASVSQLRKRIINVGSFNLVIKHQDTGATAANRFLCPGNLDITMLPNDSLDFEYDLTTTRWRIV